MSRAGLSALEPLLEHRACEPDVAPNPDARQVASADGIVDPARLDGEQRDGLVGTQKRPVKATRGQEPSQGTCSGGTGSASGLPLRGTIRLSRPVHAWHAVVEGD